jgi:hypothetical protein
MKWMSDREKQLNKVTIANHAGRSADNIHVFACNGVRQRRRAFGAPGGVW